MTTETPLISVIVPLYDVESYLRKCLDSIVHQTYRNLEIILVDDGSTDQSGAICDEYANQDTRIKVLHQNSAGVSVARNAGLDAAKGEYVLFVDSDDWIESETCAAALSIAKSKQADIVCFGYTETSPDGKEKTLKADSPGFVSKDDLIRELIWGGGVIQTMLWNKLFSIRLFDHLRFVEGRVHEDIEIMPRLVFLSDTIYVTDHVFYHYVRRKHGSITANLYESKTIKDRIFVNRERLAFLEEHYPDLADKQLTTVLRQILVGLEAMKGNRDYDGFKKECFDFIDSHRHKIKDLVGYSRLIWLYYYCKPLASLYVRLLCVFK